MSDQEPRSEPDGTGRSMIVRALIDHGPSSTSWLSGRRGASIYDELFQRMTSRAHLCGKAGRWFTPRGLRRSTLQAPAGAW